MDEFLKRLIPVVNAQSASDATAQPSFGDLTDGGNSTRVLARIDISSSKTDFNIGETFTTKVSIQTFEDTQINRFAIRITFNPNLLSVIDNDPQVEGTQIKLLSDEFEILNPADDNIVNSRDGVITIIANAENPVNFNSLKEVAEITFNTQAQGTTRIGIQSTSGGSRLSLDTRSIAYSISEKQITISNITVSQTPTPTPPNITNTVQVTPTTISNPTGIISIPDTSISEALPVVMPISAGIILLLIGISLFKKDLKDT